ncbi:MAG: ATP-binding protein [Fimbriimonadaceae bacterium]|nr:ATP-binding protein [Fimbriimonadaceae bacterium]
MRNGSVPLPAPTLPPAQEAERLRALRQLNLLDTPEEAPFDDIARLVSAICETPIALISLVEDDRQFLKSHIGLDARETTRDVSFCAHMIPNPKPLHVRDATEDARFAHNPLVEDGVVRSYLGVPLLTRSGHVLGALCAIDQRPRDYPPAVLDALQKLGRLVMEQIEARQLASELEAELRDRRKRERQSALQARAMRLLAEGRPLTEVLQAINDVVEFAISGSMSSVLLISDLTVSAVVAQSLPELYGRSLVGSVATANAGSCGAAVYHRRPVFVSDIATSSLWNEHRWLANALGVQACWSRPVLGTNDTCLATFAVYFRETRRPVQEELDLLVDVGTMVRVAIENRQREDRLNEAIAEAHRASLMKTAFLANMSHEIRTPLNGVIGMAELLSQTALTEPQRKYLRLMQTSADTLLGVINDILDVSKIEAGRLELEARPFDLRECVRSVTAGALAGAMRKGIALTVEVDQFIAPAYLGDALRIRQVLGNLISNAIKFTDDGAVLVRLYPDDEGVVLEVEDSGVGIPPDRQAAVFDSFTQADGSTSRKYGGTGLGLTIVRQLVDLMQGRIELESEVGAGTLFRVLIPIFPTDAGVETRAPDAPLPTGLRVLLVEDNAVNRLVTCEALAKLGCDVTVAEDGEQALVKVDSAEFDLILMDIQMPGLDGHQTTAAIRAREEEGLIRYRPRIVAVTAHAMESDRARCMEVGMDDYLSKPIRQSELRRAITDCVAWQSSRAAQGQA